MTLIPHQIHQNEAPWNANLEKFLEPIKNSILVKL